MYECQYDERLKTKSNEFTRLATHDVVVYESIKKGYAFVDPYTYATHTLPHTLRI